MIISDLEIWRPTEYDTCRSCISTPTSIQIPFLSYTHITKGVKIHKDEEYRVQRHVFNCGFKQVKKNSNVDAVRQKTDPTILQEKVDECTERDWKQRRVELLSSRYNPSRINLATQHSLESKFRSHLSHTSTSSN